MGGCCFVSFILPASALWPLHPSLSPTSISLHAPGELSSGLQQEVWLLTHLSCQPSHQQVSGGGNKHLCQLGMYACHICTCHRKVFQGFTCPQTLSCMPAMLLRHSLIHATCLVSTYYMPDAMVGTEAPPQNGHPRPCPRQSAGKTDK